MNTVHTVHRNTIINSSGKNIILVGNNTCDFIWTAPQSLREFIKSSNDVTITSVIMPNVTILPNIIVKPYLNLSCEQIVGQVYTDGILENVLTPLFYDFTNQETGKFIRLDPNLPPIAYSPNTATMEKLEFKIRTPGGRVYDFGNSAYTIQSMTPGATTIITIGPHLFAIGSLIYLRSIPNMSSKSVKDSIENTEEYIVTATGLNTITIVFNSSAESTNQPPTGNRLPYQLGSGSTINNVTQGKSFIFLDGVSSFSLTNPVVFDTGGYNHGYNTGDYVRITNFSNASDLKTSQQLREQKQIIVTGPTTFSIPIDFTGQTANSRESGSPTPFPLGQGGQVLDYSRQISFIMKFSATTYGKSIYL